MRNAGLDEAQAGIKITQMLGSFNVPEPGGPESTIRKQKREPERKKEGREGGRKGERERGRKRERKTDRQTRGPKL